MKTDHELSCPHEVLNDACAAGCDLALLEAAVAHALQGGKVLLKVEGASI